ncbi:transcriptional regulator family: Fungal Specific TF [Penicillium bovifimosum]|uniref:Transcriptional regulator family: Fungal Specific TF n=1 Tax=Penicillium bovifimosum TaxID=126998 RepID=A0A9W9GN61_9EURO|nr:transcriptional regulator family: Fungal Specific TF [Penicillium bovifimosum]KAJ5124097.1 transcriptional regulator family: Fungal Specific TF [Penicillium bovifimosum]
MSGSRQQPGLACEECRKKKLRCDRQRPQCDQCEESGTVCIVNQARSPRGPKKGHLKALRNRIATLESIINCGQANARPKDGFNEQYHANNTIQMLSPPQEYTPNAASPECHPFSYTVESSSLSTPITPMSSPAHAGFDMVEADLNQLYFDRVHPVVPMLHQGRYFTWSQRPDKPSSHTCLQLTMWLLAAASSAHLQHMRESLYTRARHAIEALDHEISPDSAACLQTAQAWILLTHYEYRYMNYRRAWLTAGRAFRIIQLAKLHEIDRQNLGVNMAHTEAWTEAEEKRRTYWLAYCLDRLLNISDEWPLSLHDEALYIYLPVSESDFQHGRPVVMNSLYHEMESSGEKMLPPLAETVVLITLCWHSVAIQRVAHSGNISPDQSTDTWTRHRWLYQLVQKRLMLISLPSSAPELHDPLRLFTNMLANAAVIWFYNIMEALQIDIDDDTFLVPLYSAYEIVGLAKPLTRSGFFKAHPFSPMLLYLSANFIKAHADQLSCVSVSEDTQLKLGELKKALRILQGGNNLAMGYLDLLESDLYDKFCSVSPVRGFAFPVTGQTQPPFFMDIMDSF